jgi:arginine repressor
MTEKTNIQERRTLVAALIREGYTSSRSIAKALKEKHGVDLGRSTVARDMEQLQKPSANESEHGRQVQGYEDRVQKLREMLEDPDLSKREKLAVIRTLNETSRQLLALRDRPKDGNDAKSWETEEARREWNAIKFKQLKKRSEEYDAQRRQEIRWEILAELREKGVEVPV